MCREEGTFCYLCSVETQQDISKSLNRARFRNDIRMSIMRYIGAAGMAGGWRRIPFRLDRSENGVVALVEVFVQYRRFGPSVQADVAWMKPPRFLRNKLFRKSEEEPSGDDEVRAAS